MTKTDRLALPLLATAQAQKEMTHNEALVLLDTAVQPVVVSVAPPAVPTSPAAGRSWIVGPGAQGAWTGHDGALATWTEGGWRFVAPFEGMEAWSIADACPVRRAGGTWVTGIVAARAVMVDGVQVVGARAAAIAAPAGGATVDAESRAAIAAICTTLRAHGLIA